MTELFEIGILPLILTLAAFRVGQLCQAKWKHPLLNPTLIAAILIIVFLLVTGMDIGTYKAGASAISWLMTPATIALAIPMYAQFQALKKNLRAILAGVTAGAVSSLLVILGGGLLLKLDTPLIVSLLPKSVTTPVALSISASKGGLGSITAAAVILTGIGGNLVAPILCKIFGAKGPTETGLAIGACSHAVGTARAMEMSKECGAMSGLAMGLCAIVTSVIALFI